MLAQERDESRGASGTRAAPSIVRPAAVSGAVQRAYEAHYRDVYRYLLALTRSASDAEELTAEVFERALRAWDTVPERPLPWLLLTARRIATDRWRRVVRLVGIQRRLRPGGPADAGEARTEFWAWFDALAAVLTPRQREVLVLRYQRDLSDPEIGQILGISPSGVRSLVARALEVLRAHPELQ